MNAIFQLVNPSNTITVNRPLAHALGLNEAIIYGALISKFYYYSERGMLDDGWFYSTAPDLAESTALSERQQKRAVDNLINAGLIRSELRGMPAKRSFYIVEDIAVLQQIISEGEAKMREIKPAAAERYEKKRQTSDPKPETQSLINFLAKGFGEAMPESEEDSLKSEDNLAQDVRETALLHCSDKSAEQAPTKCWSKDQQNVGASSAQTSKQHNLKKSNINNLDISIHQSRARAREGTGSADVMDEIDMQAEREYYFSVLKENISYDCLCAQNKDDKGIIDDLLSIMLEVICSRKPTVRVNGEDLAAELVKNKFLKLDGEHISYVLTSLQKSTSDVHNIRAYLITALYNASGTMGSYYQAWVNHDSRGNMG